MPTPLRGATSSYYPFHGVRRFSSTPCARRKHADHYSTLRVPRTATKAQIKTSYYQLSKQYHPDIAKDDPSRVKFHAVSEAYAILGDDRKRREYDRSIGSPFRVPHASGAGQHPQATTTRPSQQPGFKHFWPTHPRNRPRDAQGHTARHDYLYHEQAHHPHGSSDAPRPDPFRNPFVQRATGHYRRSGSSQSGHAQANFRPEGFRNTGSPSWPAASSVEAKRPSAADGRPTQDQAGAQSGVLRALGASGLVGVIMLVATIACNSKRTP